MSEKEKELKNEIKKEEMENKNEIDKIIKENEVMNQEEKNKFLAEFVLKLNNSKYFISVDSLYVNTLNDILYNFFGSFSNYVNIDGDNISLSDFLSQKSFNYSEIDKNIFR